MKKLLIIISMLGCIFATVLILYLGFLFYAHDFNPDFLKIDKCLDNGGRWNYEKRMCEYITINNDSSDICILPETELYLNELSYDIHPDSLIRHFCYPIKLDSFELAGILCKRFEYDDIIFESTVDHIYLMKTKNEKYSTPSGIKVGMKKDDVLRILDKKNSCVDFDENEWQLCCGNETAYLILYFNKNELLKEIEFSIDLP